MFCKQLRDKNVIVKIWELNHHPKILSGIYKMFVLLQVDKQKSAYKIAKNCGYKTFHLPQEKKCIYMCKYACELLTLQQAPILVNRLPEFSL